MFTFVGSVIRHPLGALCVRLSVCSEHFFDVVTHAEEYDSTPDGEAALSAVRRRWAQAPPSGAKSSGELVVRGGRGNVSVPRRNRCSQRGFLGPTIAIAVAVAIAIAITTAVGVVTSSQYGHQGASFFAVAARYQGMD